MVLLVFLDLGLFGGFRGFVLIGLQVIMLEIGMSLLTPVASLALCTKWLRERVERADGVG